MAPGADPGTIEVALDQPWHANILQKPLAIAGGGNGGSWTELKVPVKAATGVHAVWLRFTTKGQDTFKVDWFKFQ